MPREFVRPLVLLLAIGALLALRTASAPAEARKQPSLSGAVAKALVQRGWIGEPRDVVWVDQPRSSILRPIAHPRAIVRAHRRDEPSDILLVRTDVSPEGRLMRITGLSNLSDTAAVDECDPKVDGANVAYTVRVDDDTTAIHTVDLRGVDLSAHAELTWLERLQLRLTWLQESGQFAGVRKREFRIEPPAKKVVFGYRGPVLVAQIDDVSVRIEPDRPHPITGRVVEVPEALGSPGNLVTWMVDRVRALPWFGSDRMQIAKSLAFDALDRFERFRGSITKDNGVSSLADELGQSLQNSTIQKTDPETGWPPAPIEPILGQGIEREGQWLELDHDPFVNVRTGLPAPFLFSFVRTDRERQYSKVFIVLWDPRHLELHMMSGTREPKTATGETGPGQVPRDPATLTNLVGAFNGGFQATHGEFGMMADGVVYLPPKPYAATVARTNNGSTAFGTWPEDDSIPDAISSFRQNLTPLYMDDVENPYHRTWWGGVPPGWEDAARTVRTGICLTREGFVAYFYGSGIDATHLASAMRTTRCQYGLQLDMNPGHTGFEFYRVGPKGTLPDLGRKLDAQAEARGTVPGAPDYEFMSRRMIRYMNLMHFPRYVRTESRDFFYLTDRRLLPLESIKPKFDPSEPGEGVWETNGLAQHGWPSAIATSWYRPDSSHPAVKLRLVAFDTRWIRLEKCDSNSPVVIGIERNGQSSRATSLWYQGSNWQLRQDAPAPEARRVVSGATQPSSSEPPVAALGQIRESIWVYAELSGPLESRNRAEFFESAFRAIGGQAKLYFGQPIDIKLGAAAGHLPNGACFVRHAGPGGIRIFEDTPITSPKIWMPLQDKRVRYKRQVKTASQPASTAATTQMPMADSDTSERASEGSP